MGNFKIISPFKPTGDQPEAIKQLVNGIKNNSQYQTLLGVTGSGKTFTIANVIEQLNVPTLILSHNKTLAAQLYGEFKQFFPENKVEYFVSYYDYYQPEAYLPVTGTYIEKDLSINDEIEKLRIRTTSSLLSGRKDVIVISSVSCIYGIGNPQEFYDNTISIFKGQKIDRNLLLRNFVNALYSRTEADFNRGNFRVKGDTIDIYPAYSDIAYRIIFWDNEIDEIESFDPLNYNIIEKFDELKIYPANIFITSQDNIKNAMYEISSDLQKQVEFFKSIGKDLEAKRLYERVTFDLEMINEVGYCSGVENYSRYFDRRSPGSRPFCLIDYFPKDFLVVIDESHVTVPQIGGMIGGDRSRKQNLIEYGFRLPAAFDNRPLTFDEFMSITGKTIYVSATPSDFEIKKSEGILVEQVIRPTGLLDPIIEVRPCLNQIDDLINEINIVISRNERVLVTTLTKRMSEELSKYLTEIKIKTRYLHSDIETLERVKIMRDLRLGTFDVLVGVNLLREGLDLPEVSLVAILDADKEGFLRSEKSLTQTAGRAARNINGRVIMYADKITGSMKRTIDETDRRREKQIKHNIDNNITPTQIEKSHDSIITQTLVAEGLIQDDYYALTKNIVADPIIEYMSKDKLKKHIEKIKKEMDIAAKSLDFIEAARLRDELFILKEKLKNYNNK